MFIYFLPYDVYVFCFSFPLPVSYFLTQETFIIFSKRKLNVIFPYFINGILILFDFFFYQFDQSSFNSPFLGTMLSLDALKVFLLSLYIRYIISLPLDCSTLCPPPTNALFSPPPLTLELIKSVYEMSNITQLSLLLKERTLLGKGIGMG